MNRQLLELTGEKEEAQACQDYIEDQPKPVEPAPKLESHSPVASLAASKEPEPTHDEPKIARPPEKSGEELELERALELAERDLDAQRQLLQAAYANREKLAKQKVSLSQAEVELIRKEGELLNWIVARKNYKPDDKEQNFFFNLGLIEESRILLDEIQQQSLSMKQLANAASDLGDRIESLSSVLERSDKDLQETIFFDSLNNQLKFEKEAI